MDTRTERELPFFVSVAWLVVVLPASVTMFAPLALGFSVITLVGATVLYLGVGICCSPSRDAQLHPPETLFMRCLRFLIAAAAATCVLLWVLYVSGFSSFEIMATAS